LTGGPAIRRASSVSTKGEKTIAGKEQIDWPAPEWCAKENLAKGYLAVAKELGKSHGSYRNYCIRNDIPTAKAKSAVTHTPLDEVSELELAQARIKELESVTRKDRKANVYDERLTQAVEKAIGSKSSLYKPVPRSRKKAKKGEHEFVLLLSDLHAGEVVSREETGGINEYNWEIMTARMAKLANSLASYQEHRPYPIEKLHIFMLGDMLSGNIHEELEATNEFPLAEATVQLGFDLGDWTGSLTEHFPLIDVAGIVGNHPRAHKKPWAKQGYDNADWTSYHIMAESLKRNDRVTVDIPKASQHRVTVAERWNCLLFHGDGIRSSMPGVPWGGVSRRAQSLDAQYNAVGKPIDIFCLGHFHAANWVRTNAGRIAMNGAVKGVDEYSMKAFGGGAPPEQMLLTMHPENGPTDCSIIQL